MWSIDILPTLCLAKGGRIRCIANAAANLGPTVRPNPILSSGWYDPGMKFYEKTVMERKTYSIWCVAVCFLYTVFIGCSGPIHNIKKGDPKTTVSGGQLKIMTFNIRVGCGRDSYGLNPYHCLPKKKNLDLVVDAIKSEDPDVVALQEVKGYRQAKYIAEKLNMNFSYGVHFSNNKWWGLAILSTFEIIHSTTKTIYNDVNGRSGLICEIKINDLSYHIFNVHYRLGYYENQVAATMKIANQIKGPVILLGDFNRRHENRVLAPIQAEFIDTCLAVTTESSKHVMTEGTGYGRIDYIFVQDNFFSVIDVGIASSGEYFDASDHYAYYSILKTKYEK